MVKSRRNRKEIGGLFTRLDHRSRSAETVTPMDRPAGKIDFALFRPLLSEPVFSGVPEKDARPPHDAVLIFKVLVLHAKG
jgi:hypothetical protein